MYDSLYDHTLAALSILENEAAMMDPAVLENDLFEYNEYEQRLAREGGFEPKDDDEWEEDETYPDNSCYFQNLDDGEEADTYPDNSCYFQDGEE